MRAAEDVVEWAEEGGNCPLVRKLHGSRIRCRRSRTSRHQADWNLLAPRSRDLANRLARVRHLYVVCVAEKLDNSARSHESVTIVDDRFGALRFLLWQNKLLHTRPVQISHLSLIALVHSSCTAGEKDGREGEQGGGG